MSFLHQHTAHCETGVMSSLLKHHKLDVSEAMVLGLSSSLAFAYIPLVKLNGLPLIGYRMPPRHVIKGLEKNIGLDMTYKKFRSQEKGMDALDEMLEKGIVVGLQTSVFWLPYFPDDMRFHFNAHNLIVYGREDSDYLISDPVFAEPVKCDRLSLQKARFVKGALAPKGMMYYPKKVPKKIVFEQAIPKSIRMSIKIMNAPVPVIGLRGISFLANKLRKLPQKKSITNKYIRSFIGHIVRMQEEIGTGGAGFRFIYASYLQEAARVMNSSVLSDASSLMTIAGDTWREFALNAAQMSKKRSELDLNSLSALLDKCVHDEKKVWDLLKNNF
jgi:hypothetical protein